MVTLLTEEEMAVYSAFMRIELAKEWEEKVKIMRKMIKALEEKQFPWKKSVAPKIKDILISDMELLPLEEREVHKCQYTGVWRCAGTFGRPQSPLPLSQVCFAP